MHKNSRTLRIEWGDCDPAGIVFYPRYFAMFDHSTHLLLETACGLTKYEMLQAYDDFTGYPMVDTRGRFMIPCRFGEEVMIQSAFARIGRSSFEVEHKLFKNGQLCLEGFETRVWVGRDPQDASKIKSKPIPDDLVAKFKAQS
jgi:4-hydroxybenzoyl-CoA thioesterase